MEDAKESNDSQSEVGSSPGEDSASELSASELLGGKRYQERGIQDTPGVPTGVDELRGAKEYAEMIVDTVREGLLVLDFDLQVQSANQSFYEIFETRPEETTGRLIYELGNGQWDISEFHELLEEILPENKTFNDYEVEHDFEALGKRTMLLNARRLDDHELILVAIEDVTERKRGEKAFREKEARKNAIFESALDCIITIDQKSRIIEFNPAAERTFGYSRQEVLGEPMHEYIVPPHLRQAHQEGMAHYLETGEGPLLDERIEITGLRADGTEFPVELAITPIQLEGRELFTAYLRDITERKESEEALREAKEEAEAASKAKSQFLANMGHELRTPLNAVIGYSEMLTEEFEAWNEERRSDMLGRIHAAGEHLLGLINDVLDVAKSESGRVGVTLEDFDLAALASEVVEEVHPTLQENGNALETKGLEAIGDVCSDRSKVRQILHNLLSNAVKYTREGTVTLEASVQENTRGEQPTERTEEALVLPEEAEADHQQQCAPDAAPRQLVLSLSDTGIGMTDEEKTTVFEAFERGQDTEGIEGTGLGLEIVQNLCELLGGSVEVKSEKGEGSTFTVRLPVKTHRVKTRPEAKEAHAATAPIAERGQKGKTDHGSSAGSLPPQPGSLPPQQEDLVLVIDDDRDARVLLHNYLGAAGCQVATASSGPEGLEQARQLHPLAITLDVFMDGMNGWEVLSRLKKEDSALRHVPVIVVSIGDDKGRTFRLGAAEHLVKPVSRKRLIELIEEHRRREEHRPHGEGEGSSASLSVLVIDDETAVRDRVRGILEGHAEHEVQEAENGRDALNLIEEGATPDLILLDLLMPEMDGFEFLEALRERPDGSEVPVIVLTAKDLTEEDLHHLNGLAERVIEKTTYTREDLLGALHRQVEDLRH